MISFSFYIIIDYVTSFFYFLFFFIQITLLFKRTKENKLEIYSHESPDDLFQGRSLQELMVFGYVRFYYHL